MNLQTKWIPRRHAGRPAKRRRPLLVPEALEDRRLPSTVVANFEDLGLAPHSFQNNAGSSGAFVDGGSSFENTYSSDFGGIWSGWAISSMTDTTTPGFTNQYSAITGSGSGGSQTYAIGYPFGDTANAFHPAQSYVNLASGTTPVSIDVTNTTYAYLSMKSGDLFEHAFGSGDFFLLTIDGYTGPGGTGTKVGEVDFYLANFLGSNHTLVNTWQTVNLGSLAGSGSLQFGVESSQNDPQFGINTPAFFAADNLTVSTGAAGTGTVSGVVFNDLNDNGVQDNGEDGLQGWVAQLYNGSTLVASSAPTDSSGDYAISGIAPGNYTLREVPQAGYTQTAPTGSSGTYAVTVTAGGSATGLDFGNIVPTLTGITVTPAGPSVAKGLTEPFTATGTYSDHSTQNLTNQVTWASGTTSTATITAGGLATGAAVGTSTITATLGSITGSTVLTVTPAVLQSVAVTPTTPSIARGLTESFTATGTYSDQSTQDLTSQVTWASGTTSTAAITAGGLATGAAVGTSTITATLGGVSGSTTLTVTPAVLQSIAVTPAGPSVARGLTEQLAATGTYSDQSTQDLTSQVTWASGTTSAATITAGGLASGAAIGTSTITATLGSLSGSTVLTVTPAALQSIAVTPAGPSVAKGLTEPFTATGTYSDKTTQDVTSQVAWTSTTGATITAGGLATGAAVGTSTITASLGGVSGSSTLTVTPAALQSIAVTPAGPGLAKGLTEQLTATGTYSDQSTQDLTNQVTWASGTASTATITAGGLASAAAIGTSTITATLGSLSGSTVLTVTPAALQSIAITPPSLSVAKGLTEQFSATGTYSDQSTQDLTSQVVWASSASSTAPITAGGLASAAAIGTSTITATLGNISGSTTLTVTPAVLQSIAVTPSNPSVVAGQTESLSATGIDTDGSTQPLTSQVTWASNLQAIATVTAAGVATGASAGVSTISATLGNISGSTVLTVTPATLLSIAVTPSGPSVVAGHTALLSAIGTYSNQSTHDLTDQVTWTSSAPVVATVSSAGLIRGAAAGTAILTATLSGVSGSTTLTVNAPTLVSLSVTAASTSLADGLTEPFTATGTYSDGSTRNLTAAVTWASANHAVATISRLGLSTAVATGRSTITATLNGLTSGKVLTVTAPSLVSIVVLGHSKSVAKGLTTQLTATGVFSDHTKRDLTGEVIWASADRAVATVSRSGVATGVAAGTATISATLGSVRSALVLQVAPASTATSLVTLTSLGVERVTLGARTVTALVAGFSGPLSAAAAQKLAAYTVTSGRSVGTGSHAQVVFQTPVTLAQAVYDATRNRVILVPVSGTPLPRLERLQINVALLTDPQGRPINRGKTLVATATPNGLLITPAGPSAAGVDALFA